MKLINGNYLIITTLSHQNKLSGITNQRDPVHHPQQTQNHRVLHVEPKPDHKAHWLLRVVLWFEWTSIQRQKIQAAAVALLRVILVVLLEEQANLTIEIASPVIDHETIHHSVWKAARRLRTQLVYSVRPFVRDLHDLSLTRQSQPDRIPVNQKRRLVLSQRWRVQTDGKQPKSASDWRLLLENTPEERTASEVTLNRWPTDSRYH